LLGLLPCLRAQEQEGKLVDRLLRPNMTLESSEQHKTFTADKTGMSKKANVKTAYLQQKNNTKAFVDLRDYRRPRRTPIPGRSMPPAITPTKWPGKRKRRANLRHHHASDTGDFAGRNQGCFHQRIRRQPQICEKGKSQKFLDRKNPPMTIEQVRELLNKTNSAVRVHALFRQGHATGRKPWPCSKRARRRLLASMSCAKNSQLGRPLRVEVRRRSTSADIHLGHTMVLRKLRQFQDLGHQAVLIIGDFTGMIGDPSGRSVTRPHLMRDIILANAETYREQAFKVLDPAHTEIVFNGDWFREMKYEEVIRLNSRVTLQQMLQREDFSERLDRQQPIHAHEIQYPIMQGWDSVMVKADVELGGTDQLFNILVGRDFQREQNMPQQVVFLLPILEGLEGGKKMSRASAIMSA